MVISPPGHHALRSLESLRDYAEINVSNDAAALEKHAGDAEVILLNFLGNPVKLSQIWPRAKRVRWVHSLSAGVESILFSGLRESSVVFTNARGVFKRPLAEFALLGILFHTKRVRRLIDNQQRRAWEDFTVGLADRRVLGIVGYGEIGRECAQLAKGLGMIIHAIRRNPEKSAADPLVDRLFKPDELDHMLAGVDVLVCAAPLTPDTHHMLGDRQFAAMKQSAIVINVGRGPVIDEQAMIRALQNGRIAGAALDVFEIEPLPQSSPLWDMGNVLISPHCTDRTEDPDWLETSMRCFLDNFHRYRQSQPLENVVDKRLGY